MKAIPDMDACDIKRRLEFNALEEEQARERIAYCAGQVKHLRDDSADAIAFYGHIIEEVQDELGNIIAARRNFEYWLKAKEAEEQPSEEEPS